LASRGVRGSRPANPFPDHRYLTAWRDVALRQSISEDTFMNTGTVKFYNSQKGFGFIEPVSGGKDVFVHASALERAGLGGLAEGQKLQFDLEEDGKGRSSAANLHLI